MEYRAGTTPKSIQNFTDLRVWQTGHTLVVEIYKVTKQFPREEVFGLTSQLRRAAVSITSNIAEGFGRQSYKEKVQFYHLAYGSLTEVQNQLLISKDIGYITDIEFTHLINMSTDTAKLLRAFISKSKTFC
ncbi:MAG: four helix bundle protein [Patescibacteria group bacterium]